MSKSGLPLRRTKIVATLGPATDKPSMLNKVLSRGVDLVRLNYSHDKQDAHASRIEAVRNWSRSRGRPIGIIADLQGPKIRIGRFQEGRIHLEPGDEFTIDVDLKPGAGDEHQVGCTYKPLPDDVKQGDTLLIDDGRLVLQVDKVTGTAVQCVVLLGGELTNNKGLNKEGGGLSAPALTRKDRADLRHAVQNDVDYIAVSFPRCADDIEAARKLIEKENGRCGVIAKIERAEAVDEAEPIIEASDCVMVARGDLGVEIGDAPLVPVQKKLIRLAREHNRMVITATQMMQSMIENPIPTRAEVFDVANAVLDGTDAVMLSAETSVGRYPDKVVEAMARICLGTEQRALGEGENYRLDDHFERIDQAIAVSAIYAGSRLGAKAIAAMTETGATCRWMSRMSSSMPIFAFTPHAEAQRRVTLYRGVYPVHFDVTHSTYEQINHDIIKYLKKIGVVEDGDTVLITKGDVFGRIGGTNGLKIIRVGETVSTS